MAVISTLGAVFSIVETGFSVSRSRLCDAGSFRQRAEYGHGSAAVGRYEAGVGTSIPHALSPQFLRILLPIVRPHSSHRCSPGRYI